MEIERKFLTKHIPFDITAYPYKQIAQAYISFSPTIRIRQSDADYILTVKGKGHLAREEFELPLQKEDYDRLFLKQRAHLSSRNVIWCLWKADIPQKWISTKGNWKG